MVLLPDVALVGAMKAGTTSLAYLMDQHPKLAIARANAKGLMRKEPGFFSRDERYAYGIDWYAEHFSHAAENQLCVDASTCYSRSTAYPRAMERLCRSNPNAKLIYVLRHPVERAYSHYVHDARFSFFAGAEVPTLKKFLATDKECIAASRYDVELEHMLQFFPRENLLCLRFDELKANSDSLLSAISEFLGIAMFDATVGMQVFNKRDQAVKSRATRQAVENITNSEWATSAKRFVPEGLRTNMRGLLRRVVSIMGVGQRANVEFSKQVSPLTADIEMELHAKLDPHTRRLGEMLGWDVSSWLTIDNDSICSPSHATFAK